MKIKVNKVAIIAHKVIFSFQTHNVMEIYANSQNSQQSSLALYSDDSPESLELVASFKSNISKDGLTNISRIHANRRITANHKQLQCESSDSWMILYVTQATELCGNFETVWSHYKSINKQIQLLVLTPYMLDEHQIRTGCIGNWLQTLGADSNDVTFVETREQLIKLTNLETLSNFYLKDRYKEGDKISMLLMSELYLQSPAKLNSCYTFSACGKADIFNTLILKSLGKTPSKVISCVRHTFNNIF